MKSAISDLWELFVEDANQWLMISDELKLGATVEEVTAFVNSPDGTKQLRFNGSVVSFCRRKTTGACLDETNLSLLVVLKEHVAQAI